MNRMLAALRSFRVTLGVVLPLVCIAGVLYAYLHSIPAGIATALLAALLVEVGLYLTPGFPRLRDALEARFSPRMLALWMIASALLPYLIYALPTGQFNWVALIRLGVLAGVASFWYACLPPRPVVDLVFVAVVAAVVLSKVFSRIYLTPAPQVHLEVLGQLMWIRLGVLAILTLRHMEGTGFGFLPAGRDWKIGLRYFLYFVPLGVALSLGLGFASFHPHADVWWWTILLTVGTFAGMLWVVALSEEFFFRGLLQQWLSRGLKSEWAGLLATSVLFGVAHLPFRAFPNWRFAIVAAVAGLFYGQAYRKARSIRAAMVTHALVNTTWRLLFS
jgi:membrane protease YdiL (CAAX protease family)